jgi:hypothetical protein
MALMHPAMISRISSVSPFELIRVQVYRQGRDVARAVRHEFDVSRVEFGFPNRRVVAY